ncbi:hypothetical protein QN386_17910 [Pseudomonas sp. CCI3.2]|nr:MULTISPECIES: hypothetical protein [unclassified Pseudomonas]MEB0078069.1 hypothetical protein [Pseudomonas sp. MH10out]MEB0103185.1 hypothetical protein [Pseudomonas sp. CCI3.2]
MPEIKHTPGPWAIGDYEGPCECSDLVYAAPRPHGQNPICSLTGYFPREQRMANSKLIAASPELLEALQALVKINVEHNEAMMKIIGRPTQWNDSYLDLARAVIAKATL